MAPRVRHVVVDAHHPPGIAPDDEARTALADPEDNGFGVDRPKETLTR